MLVMEVSNKKSKKLKINEQKNQTANITPSTLSSTSSTGF